MMILLTIQACCSSTALWLYTVKYYETSSDIDCILRRTDAQNNITNKKWLRNITGTMLIISLLSYIPYDVSSFINTSDHIIKTQNYLSAFCAVSNAIFLVIMMTTQFTAFVKIIKLVQFSNKEQANNFLIGV